MMTISITVMIVGLFLITVMFANPIVAHNSERRNLQMGKGGSSGKKVAAQPDRPPTDGPEIPPKPLPACGQPCAVLFSDRTVLDKAIRQGQDFAAVNRWCFASTLTDFSFLFSNTGFNEDISCWDVSRITNMQGMFSQSPFDQNIADWNVESVTNMAQMFRNSPFNQPLQNWNVRRVTTMNEMFSSSPFNQNLCSWGPRMSTTVIVTSMFNSNPCPIMDDPNLNANPKTPLCSNCF